jgi:diguanylate cyclase (GGDEF)-like protein
MTTMGPEHARQPRRKTDEGLGVERERTDSSLRSEREEADFILRERDREIVRKVENALRRSRFEADGALKRDRARSDLARQKRRAGAGDSARGESGGTGEDEGPGAGIEEELRKTEEELFRERARADEILQRERSLVDEALRLESALRREVEEDRLLRARTETDDDLLHEREQTDELLQSERTRSRTDRLTDLPNSRLFLERLTNEAVRCRETLTPLCLLYLDIDNFKNVNELFGYAAGDDLLKQISSILGSAVRKGDVAARVGGDEFALLLSDLPLKATEATAERIMRHIRRLDATYPGASLGASVGLVYYDIPPADGAEILQRADAAMHEAKAAGRNTLMAIFPRS